MSQSAATKLVSKLRFKIGERRRLTNPEGPQGRHNKIKKAVTALFKHERIEMNYNLADESRGYAERLISDAIRYGDTHTPTMEMASYWITEPQIVHKLFKVLAPRYQNLELSYTKLWFAPKVYPGYPFKKCVLELRGNIYPPLGPDKSYNKNLIHNVLLEEAKKEYRKIKEEKLKTAAAAAETQSMVSGTDVKSDNETSGSSADSVEMSAAADDMISETDGKQSDVHETSAAAEGNVESEKESELPEKENVVASSSTESLKKSEVNTSEVEVDLNKINITEEKETDSPSGFVKK